MRLSALDVKMLHREMFETYDHAQLRAVGIRIREQYGRTESDRAENAERLEQLRNSYKARAAILERNDPRGHTNFPSR